VGAWEAPPPSLYIDSDPPPSGHMQKQLQTKCIDKQYLIICKNHISMNALQSPNMTKI